MTHDKQGHYSLKEAAARAHDPALVAEVERSGGAAGLACAAAEELAAGSGCPASAVGAAADSREIKLVACQLGLFGYETASGRHPAFAPAETVAPELERAVREALADGRLSCEAAWAIAAGLGIGRLDVARAAEGLGVRISACQLGAF
ncbi:MAG TPA: hypothetical protein VM285_01020 [Polyangia bacterium]|nr:hypothetical protein [Polyangia bacterium]